MAPVSTAASEGGLRLLPFERNLVGGRWQFPRAPYEFEIRSPVDSAVIAVVPLSSRFDVDDAVSAGQAALDGPWSDAAARRLWLETLLARLQHDIAALARIQSIETGLDDADSIEGIELALAAVRDLDPLDLRAARPGVTGHILCWGQPFADIVTSVVPALAEGCTAVVKPSLAAPLSAVAFAQAAVDSGLPPGVVNIIQGTGIDVGAAISGNRALRWVNARGGTRTLAAVARAGARTDIPSHLLHGGGNVFVVGPGAVDREALSIAVADAVRLHAGPFGVPVLAVHRDASPVVDAVVQTLSSVTAAPLATGFQRDRVLGRVADLVASGARLMIGGTVPDDVEHRMGWRLPPVVASLEGLGPDAVGRALAADPVGPVLLVLPFTAWSELGAHLTGESYRAGIATVWGEAPPREITEGFGKVVVAVKDFSYPGDVGLAPAWTAHP